MWIVTVGLIAISAYGILARNRWGDQIVFDADSVQFQHQGSIRETVTRADLIFVATPSQAAIAARPTSGYIPLVVVFTDVSAGDVGQR